MQSENQKQDSLTAFEADNVKAREIVNKFFNRINLKTIFLLIVVSIPLLTFFNNIILDDLASPNSRILSVLPMACRL